MKIAVAGAGAMGGRFGYMMHKAGYDITFIDQWHENVKVINEQGLKVNYNGDDVVANIPIFTPEDISKNGTKFDVIILYTKAMQLDSMLSVLKPVLYESTFVACLLNGIGHENVIEKYVPLERQILGNTMWTAGLVGPGHIKLFGNGTVELQNLGPLGEEVAKKLVEIFNKAELGGIFSKNIKETIYKKACVNGVVNGLCTILETNMSGFGSTSYAPDIVKTIVKEFVEVGAKEGAILDADRITAGLNESFDPSGIGLHYPSMYQDLVINNRLTEIDYINGAIVERGKKHGIDTPYCKLITQLVHCKEEIKDAK